MRWFNYPRAARLRASAIGAGLQFRRSVHGRALIFGGDRSGNRHSPSSCEGYTLIELLALIFIIAVVTAVHEVVRARLGQGAAFVASALAVVACALLVVLLYRWSWRRDRQQLAELRENYRSVYRVKALPAEPNSIVKPHGAQICIGDYGWDARPNRPDGLVHLQGLTLRWQVVWHAGFRPDQIEKVATKPASQYQYWAPYWAKPPLPPPCPFPVCERSTPTMGLPHHSGRYFADYPSQYYQSASDVPERLRDGAT